MMTICGHGCIIIMLFWHRFLMAETFILLLWRFRTVQRFILNVCCRIRHHNVSYVFRPHGQSSGRYIELIYIYICHLCVKCLTCSWNTYYSCCDETYMKCDLKEEFFFSKCLIILCCAWLFSSLSLCQNVTICATCTKVSI